MENVSLGVAILLIIALVAGVLLKKLRDGSPLVNPNERLSPDH